MVIAVIETCIVSHMQPQLYLGVNITHLTHLADTQWLIA